MRLVLLIAALSVLPLQRSASANPVGEIVAQAPAEAADADPLFPPAGRVSALAASGIPFLGIGEVTYGFSEQFALGLFAATTPDLPGIDGTLAVGVRPRGVLHSSGRWRVVAIAPVLFYPKVRGFGDREPWMLARPTAMVERTFASGARVGAGAGLIAAACTTSIFSLGREHDMEGGVWQTVNVSFSVPVARRTSLFAEVSLVLDGAAIARNWIGVTPVVAFAGLTTTL